MGDFNSGCRRQSRIGPGQMFALPFADGPCMTVEARRAPSVEMPAEERRIETRRPEKLIVIKYRAARNRWCKQSAPQWWQKTLEHGLIQLR